MSVITLAILVSVGFVTGYLIAMAHITARSNQ